VDNDASAIGGLDRSQFLRRGAAGAAGLALLGAAGCGSDGKDGGTSTASSDQGKPPSKPTGTLRVGLPVGVAGVIADPTVPGLGIVGMARAGAIHDFLFQKINGKLVNQLATGATGSADAKTWDVTLREGVTFTNGKPVRPEDVLFTIKYMQRKASAVVAQVPFASAKKTGPNSFQVVLLQPDALFKEKYASTIYVLPEDYDPQKPVGSGPYKLESYTPGRKTTLVANADYWGEGPYTERVEIYEFADDTARVNALLAKQVDAIEAVPAAQLHQIGATPGLAVERKKSDLSTPFVMNTQAAPFDDVRVRQAFRLIVDRPAMIAQAFGGSAKLGNDVTDLLAPDYVADTFPQRAQDIEQAKSLLKAAGHDGLNVELNTSPIGVGAVDMSQVFAEQAKAAGVTVKLKQIDPSQFFTPQTGWLSYPFSVSIGGSPYLGYLANIASILAPGAFAPETNWKDAEWTRLFKEAAVTLDETKRNELSGQLQRIDYDRGGYIISCFLESNTCYSKKVKGLNGEPGPGMNLYRFHTLWLA
jgi:peptide/nickel transport system substrate-binding protein